MSDKGQNPLGRINRLLSRLGAAIGFAGDRGVSASKVAGSGQAARLKSLVLLAPVIGFVAAMAILMLIVVLVGESPLEAIRAISRIAFGDMSRFATIFSQAIPLFFAGIAAAFAFQAGVFNVGIEGQYFVGGLTASLVGIYLKVPLFLHIPLVVLGGMVGGALWASIPALLKVRRGVHEVITTIMFNTIGILLINYLVNVPLSGREEGLSLVSQTLPIQETALFGKLNGLFRALGLNIADHVLLDYSLIVAVLLGVVVYIFFYRTRFGFDLRSVGVAPTASRYGGIRVGSVSVAAFLGSGAIAGLIGLQEIFAIRGYYTFELASGVGFDGIAIALIGRNNPIGVAFAALLFSFLKLSGYGLQIYTSVPNSVTFVISGLMIIMIVVTNELIVRYVRNVVRKDVGVE